jgi:hypothetical protein
MQLVIPGHHNGLYQRLGLGHGLVGRQVPPRMRAEMIRPQQDATGCQAMLGCQALQRPGKIDRRHAAVPAAPVDLMGGGFHQQQRLVLLGLPGRCLQDLGVG